MEIGEALEEYWAVKHATMKQKTLHENKRVLGYFRQYCESQQIQLEDIKARTISAYLDHTSATRPGKSGNPISSHTLYLHVSLIKAFLNWCATDEEMQAYVSLAMIARIQKPKQTQFTRDILTKEHIHSLLRACDKMHGPSQAITVFLADRNRAILFLLLDTGIRAAELCNLQLDHLSLLPSDPHIRVVGKGDKWREIGLGERSRKELRRYINKHRESVKNSPEPVFLTWRKHPLTEDMLFRIVKDLGQLAQLEGIKVSPHIFRHSYAVYYIRAGGDIYRLSKLMGHSSVKITEQYLKSFQQTEARIGSIHPVNHIF